MLSSTVGIQDSLQFEDLRARTVQEDAGPDPALGDGVPVTARLYRVEETWWLQIHTDSAQPLPLLRHALSGVQMCKAGKQTHIYSVPGEPAVVVRSQVMSTADALWAAIQERCRPDNGGIFEAKTDKASSDLYFHHYGMLEHQQNMLQDQVRTGIYYHAILENHADFQGKVVVDVGAGSGILSLFAVQAGAKKVYAVEASNMAHFARQLIDANPTYRDVMP
eukprot:gene32681-41567_t